jgi:hypothetical protein
MRPIQIEPARKITAWAMMPPTWPTTDRAGLHQAGDHGQDHQAQHVVDHRRAEHDARRRRVELAQVAEDPAGDADRGRRQVAPRNR